MEKPKEKEEEQGSPESDTSFEANSLPADLRFPLHLYRELITKKYQQLLLRYNTCFSCLQHQFTDLNLLQQENLSLRSDNLDLSILISTKENEIMTAISGDLLSEYLRLGVSGNCESRKTVEEEAEELLMQQRGGNLKEIAEEKELKSSVLTRGSVVPKCVSVRSNKYLTVKDSSKGADVTGETQPLRLRLVSKPVKGKEEAEVELELYNQGMVKTELCNKWEETGECPYEERCQFAHGIQELRPVIRHPRYKTEICRMIISGGTCPYGHRCHFRHSLDPKKEKEVVL